MRKLFSILFGILLLFSIVGQAVAEGELRTFTVEIYNGGYADGDGGATIAGGASKYFTWTKNSTVATTADNKTLDLAKYAPKWDTMSFQLASIGTTDVAVGACTYYVVAEFSNYDDSTHWAGASPFTIADYTLESGTTYYTNTLPDVYTMILPASKYARLRFVSGDSQWVTPVGTLVMKQK
uniref:Uncharacterized protein n=1 Tax=viral metagenome TaxID=1070528 RepID=A0A6M3JCA1_9ZZZZ